MGRLDAFLPGDDEMRHLTRAWLAWTELWRSEPWLTETIGELRARELLRTVSTAALDRTG